MAVKSAPARRNQEGFRTVIMRQGRKRPTRVDRDIIQAFTSVSADVETRLGALEEEVFSEEGGEE